MNRIVALLVAVLLCDSAVPQEMPQRPHIRGIEGVTIYVSNVADARAFYNMVLEQIPKHCRKCNEPLNLNISLNKFQSILLEPSHPPAPSNLIAEITFWTDNVPALGRYLVANKIDVGKLPGPGIKYLSVTDPEGHKISFLESDGVLKAPKVLAIQSRGGQEREIIHSGVIVHDRP